MISVARGKKHIPIWCLSFTFIFFSCFGVLQKAIAAPAEAELPRVYLDTSYPDTSTYSQVTVPAGGNLQAAIDNAQCGTVIKLQANATYTGNFFLRNKGDCGSQWIVITSTEESLLPSVGTRVKESDAVHMPKLIDPSRIDMPVVYTESGANHYRLVGLHITTSYTARDYVFQNLVYIGAYPYEDVNPLEALPHDIYLDRTYIHGTTTANVYNGVLAIGNRIAVTDSIISDIHAVGYESHAIGSYEGNGPIKIVNNFLEAAGINILFGGATPRTPDTMPRDIVIRGNRISKHWSWWMEHPSYAGIRWTVKNFLEIKMAERVLVEGNVFENNWADAQDGAAVVIVAYAEGTSWGRTRDVTFRNNIIRHAGHGPRTGGGDAATLPTNINISNNLLYDLDNQYAGGYSSYFMVWCGNTGLTVEHNTILHTGTVVGADGRPNTNAVFRNNYSRHNTYGVFGSGTSIGLAMMDRYMPGGVLTENVLAGGAEYASLYPSGNFFPELTVFENGFVNPAAGDYRLKSDNPYVGAATDGKDIGADIPAVMYATRGALSGVWNVGASLSPTSQSFGASDGSGTVNVTSLTGGGWNALSNSSWISVTSGASGSGNGTVSYSVSANTASSPRTGTMTIAGETFTVNQKGSGGGGVIAVDSLSMDFGRVRAGETSSLQIRIFNKGTGPLDLRGITFISRTLGIFSHGGACQSLAPGESCSLEVKFSPAYKGLFQGIMKTYSNGGSGKAVQIRLRGIGN